MDLNQSLNSMSWKKIAIIALSVIGAFWLIRELVFIELLGMFKHTYTKFTTQFDKDQDRIHNFIEDNFKKHKEMQQEMDQKTKEFHDYVDKSFGKTFSYLNNDNNKSTSSANQNIKNDDQIEETVHLQKILDKQSWEIVRRRYLLKTGTVLPSYEEFERVFSEPSHG